MKTRSVWMLTALLLAAAVVGGLSVGAPRPTADPDTGVYRVVGEWDGRLAVFLPGGTAPEQVFDTRVASLPEGDRRRLEEGIPVADHAALTALLEDYTS